jgi:sigma-B regulation protein RsbU (phosphoserine phosphatase)
MLKFKTMQGRFTVFMMLPVGLLLVGAGLIGFFYARSSLLQQWRKTAVLELQQEAHRIDMLLNRPKQIIEMYRESTTAAMGSHHIRDWLLEQLRDLPGVIRLDLEPIGDQARRPESFRMHRGPGWMDDDAGPMWSRRMMGMTRITPPRYNSEGNYETVSLITEMETASGRGAARLEVVIRLDDIFANIEASGLWRDHQAFLLDDGGRVIYERDGGALDKPFYEIGRLESRTFEAMMRMPYGTLLGAGHPPQRVAGFYGLMEAPWTLVMIAPGKQILQPIQRFGFYYLVFGACFILIVLVLIRWTSLQTVDGIRRLSLAARKVAQGEYEENLQIKTEDEVGELTRSFNAMISHLKARMRLERVINLAKEVQQNLLPIQPLQIGNLEVVGRSVYCEATGGDYFDYFQFPELGENRVGVVVGDVAGHGVGAALFMTTVRALLRSRITQPGSLSDVLADVNRHLCLDTENSGNFMTLFFMLLDCEGKGARWVRAGHDPALRYDPVRDAFQELKGEGIALGVSCDWSFEEYRLDGFSPGEIIVLGTDGVWETENPNGERFGKARLREIIRDNHSKSPAELTERIITGVQDFHGTATPEDDITLVVIKRNAAGESGWGA